jgi:DNA-binding transcriptional LysR family regulator
MNLRFLETFVWVARLKNFRLTAEKLLTTQASISSRIAVLEQDLGVRLFLRDSRGVSLTPDGQRVLDYAERVVDTMHHMRQSIDRARLLEGRIRIGAIDAVVHTWLGDLVARVTQAHPLAEIELTADTAANLCDQLERGNLDIAFQTDPLRVETVRNLELAKYPMHWIAAAGTPYDRPYGSLAELAQERVITFSKHSRPHHDMLSMMHLHGVEAPRVNCVNSVSAIARLLCDGFGIGALPLALVRRELAQGTLTMVAVASHPPPLDLVASWRTGAGLELVEEVVALSLEAVNGFCDTVGPQQAVSLRTPGMFAERPPDLH